MIKEITTILAVFSSGLVASAQTGNESKITDELSNREEVIAWPESMTDTADQLMQTWQAQH